MKRARMGPTTWIANLQQQAEFRRTWAQHFQEHPRLLATYASQEDARDEIQPQLSRLRAELARLNKIRSLYHEQEQALQPGKQYHGRVWLFLRDKSALTAQLAATPDTTVTEKSSIDGPTQNRPVEFTISVDPSNAKPGDVVTLTIRGRAASGWRIYDVKTPRKTGVATKIALGLPDGITKQGEWKLPESQVDPTSKSSAVYRGDFEFQQTLTVASDVVPGPLKLRCRITYQLCDKSICLPPRSSEFVHAFDVSSD